MGVVIHAEKRFMAIRKAVEEARKPKKVVDPKTASLMALRQRMKDDDRNWHI